MLLKTTTNIHIYFLIAKDWSIITCSWNEKEGVSKLIHSLFYAQSPDFLKPGLCYFLKFLYL